MFNNFVSVQDPREPLWVSITGVACSVIITLAVIALFMIIIVSLIKDKKAEKAKEAIKKEQASTPQEEPIPLRIPKTIPKFPYDNSLKSNLADGEMCIVGPNHDIMEHIGLHELRIHSWPNNSEISLSKGRLDKLLKFQLHLLAEQRDEEEKEKEAKAKEAK